MKVLFIGGTGEISAACARRAVSRGLELTLLNRGISALRPAPPEARVLRADVRDPAAVVVALAGERFDVVVNFLAFTPEHVEADIERFDTVGQYVFISSASAYQTPPSRLPVTESTPLRNPVWPYSQAKIACENRLLAAYRERGFPVTIVRPSHTYDRTGIPYDPGWTVVERMRSGRPVVVHGDGTSLWTLTHADDFAKAFVGLLGHPAAVGDSFHITSDEALTWNAIHGILAEAAGAEARIVHVPSDLIARHDEEWGRALLGDKTHSMVFDNTKIRRLVPDYVATIPFVHGAREMIAWHDADASRRQVDPRFDRLFDELVERYAVTS
jgi:nucleoside-diphosphate-sugar epimerase